MASAPAEPHSVERWYLKYSILLGIFVALLGCGYSDGHVYKRFRSLDCSSGVFNRAVPNSARCCDDENDWVCAAAYDELTASMSSAWAWALPLAPLGMRALGEGLSASPLRSQLWRRLGIYVTVFSYRTLVLYRLLNFIEGLLQPGEISNHSCWYKEITARCKEAFDFSDHVVLMLVHYCAPAAVELGHAVRSLSEGKAADMSCLIAAAASLALFASAFRALFFTSIYFHTAAEIIAASLVVLLLFCLPALYLLRRAPALLGHRS